MNTQNFSFKLGEKAWVFEEDENQVFRALELSDGRYLISFNNNDGFQIEYFQSAEEVLKEIAEGYWIILD